MNSKKEQSEAPLDILYVELVRAVSSDGGSSLLDICLHGTQREIKAVPLRYRLIALGFVNHLSPEEVNRRLLENGCPQLYARSFWEASVIYALRKELSYAQWKELLAQCEDLREKIVSNNRDSNSKAGALSDSGASASEAGAPSDSRDSASEAGASSGSSAPANEAGSSSDSRAVSRKAITLSDIRAYVENNSMSGTNPYATQHVTKALEEKLADAAAGGEMNQPSDAGKEKGALPSADREGNRLPDADRDKDGLPDAGREDGLLPWQTDFRDFLSSNLASFSTVREKARYYFCKYLLYDLDRRKKLCAESMNIETADERRKKTDLPSDSILLSDLRVFRVKSSLLRKKHTSEKVCAILENARLSLREIYTLYGRFYFEYPFHDWYRILSESGTDPLSLPPEAGKTLADAVRRDPVRRDVKVKKPKHGPDSVFLAWLQGEFQYLENSELEKQDPEKQDSEEEKASPQSGRAGENFLRKVLHGTLDLDRTTLLSFLLFFGNSARPEIPAAHRIDRERLNVILEECGFPPLDPALPFDRFVRRFLESSDPLGYLIEEAEQMALSGKNFYLYLAWLHSKSAEAQWRKIT